MITTSEVYAARWRKWLPCENCKCDVELRTYFSWKAYLGGHNR